MFCPSCGTQLTQELVYCPRCGANLASPVRAAGASPARLTGATWALALATVLVTLGGLGMVFAFVITALTRSLSMPRGFVGLMFFFLAVILAVASLLVYQLSRVVTLFKSASDEPTAAKRSQPLMEGSPARARLEEPRAPVSSVTDHTTRTFEPLPRERQTRS